MSERDVSHIKAFLNMGFKFGNVLVALKDGFQLLKDVPPIVDAAKAVPGGLAAAPKALEEYLSMDDEEALDLEEWVVTTFDIPNDAVEAVIESGLRVVIQLHSLAEMLKPKS